jgi:hypothetical protein
MKGTQMPSAQKNRYTVVTQNESHEEQTYFFESYAATANFVYRVAAGNLGFYAARKKFWHFPALRQFGNGFVSGGYVGQANRTLSQGTAPWYPLRAAAELLIRVQHHSGRYVALAPLLELGFHGARESAECQRWGSLAHYPGYGPVPGVSNGRWPRGCYYRRVKTFAEIRENCLVVEEDGEKAARCARTGRNLPTVRDDISREKPRCWKSQHRGAKSWDKPYLAKTSRA